MTPARKKRLTLITVLILGTGLAVGLILKAMNENVMFFFSPTQVKAGEAPKNRPFRIGGMVVTGSVKRSPDSVKVVFDLADAENSVPIEYSGILPDLFREGQGIIANGRLNEKGHVIAEEVLAKHDENYMPPEVAEMMKPKMAKSDTATKQISPVKSQ
jgi:cytochrome c-type biogenesis protein CcmE